VDLHCGVGVAPLHPSAADEEDPAAGGELPAGTPSALAATIVARMNPKTGLREGERARVHVDLTALHFFDPDNGTSLQQLSP
jgi:hypothetical protein